jgi:branched-chain amino acid aminotransferase
MQKYDLDMSTSSQNNRYVWFGEKIVATDKALISAISPSARYGLSVFEGIRGYLTEDSKGLNIYRLEDHISRLFESAERISIPIPLKQTEIVDAVIRTIKANEVTNDCYIRVDILSTQIGSWHSQEPGLMTITVIDSVKEANLQSRTLSAAISTWKRIDESQMPPSVKTGANYINSRYGYLEVKSAGYDVPIFLNLKGDVSESSGACIMAVIEGRLVTPPTTAQILNSITRDTLLNLAIELEIDSVERDINPLELKSATEIFLCGTAVELAPILKIDGKIVGFGSPGSTSKILFENYLKEVRSIVGGCRFGKSTFMKFLGSES